PAAVGAHFIGKTIDLNFGQPILNRALDYRSSPLDFFILGEAGRLLELIDKRLLLRFRSMCRALSFIRLLRLGFGDPDQEVFRLGEDVISYSAHGSLLILNLEDIRQLGRM